MNTTNSLIVHSLPIATILISLEVYELIKVQNFAANKKDIGASLAIGLSAFLLNIISQGLNIFIYTFFYQHRLFTLPTAFWGSWVICLLSEDLSFYWFHRLSHQVRFLWASHLVHHSSERFAPSVAVRNPLTGEITGTLLRIWMPLIGLEPSLIFLMRVIVVVYQFFMHTENIKRLPKWYEFIFNTPYYHGIHHSSNVEYLDKNHRGLLIIWDKIFGTFQHLTTQPKYGLVSNIGSYHPVTIAFYEWKKLIKDLRKARSAREIFNYLFNSPGWSPNGSTKTTKQQQALLKTTNITIHP